MRFDILWSRRPGRDSRFPPGAAWRGARKSIARPRVEALESRRLLSVTIHEFYIPASPASAPTQITAGPDGNLWFTEASVNSIGEINPITHAVAQFPLPTPGQPNGITAGGIAAGPDGNVWFTEIQANKIGEINPTSHVITEFPLPGAGSGPEGITAGPAGTVWFAGGEINPVTHAITAFPSLSAEEITTGSDGNLWFTTASGVIGRFNPTTHALTNFLLSSTNQGPPAGITTGPDGKMWFTEGIGNKIGMIDPATGVVSEFALPTPGSHPLSIAAGADGNLWFTEESPLVNKIGEINPASHVITEFAVPAAVSLPYGITAGPDGNLWFTEQAGQNIGQVVLATRTAPSGDGPMITDVRRPGPGARAGALVLSFDEPLDPAHAQDLANYRLVALGRRGRTIRVRSAVYDSATRTVSLIPAHRLRPRQHFRLTVIGAVPSGVTDGSGNLLDGQMTGHPGSNFVTIV
jgi:streptogramin lyase